MLIDLNAERSARAAKREGRGDAVQVPFGDQTFLLPAELPARVVDHLLDPEVEIAQLLIMALRSVKEGSSNDNTIALITEVLAERPDLPLGFVRAVLTAVEQLFGDEQWAAFQKLEPSAQDLLALVRGLIKVYGTGLGEVFSSSESSENAGTTLSATSSGSTDSTSAASGGSPESPASLASVG
jgi:hypothetical protein